MLVQKFIFLKGESYCLATHYQLMFFFGVVPPDVYVLDMREGGLYVVFLKTVEVNCSINVVVDEG